MATDEFRASSRPSDERSQHWNRVYSQRAPTDLSWHQDEPEPSLKWIRAAAPDRGATIIDVGGGASHLAARLLDSGYADVVVLDVSEAAVSRSRAQLGSRAEALRWIIGDVTADEDFGQFAIWHDRAVFHFLRSPVDRDRYRENARRSLLPNGRIIVSTFASDGPTECSGLAVRRYDAAALTAEFGDGFRAEKSERFVHRTPGGPIQPFTIL